MKLGMEVGLGPGNIWGPSSQKKGAQQPLPNFRSMPVISHANGWMDHATTWYGDMPRLRPHCVRWEPSSPQRTQPPNFRPMSVVAKRSPIPATAELLFATQRSSNLIVICVASAFRCDDRDFRTAWNCTSPDWYCGRYHSVVFSQRSSRSESSRKYARTT